METIGLILSCLLALLVIIYLLNLKKKNQLQKIFILNSFLAFGWCSLLLVQKYFCASNNINPIVFDWFIYIFICFLPVSILFTGIIFANTKIVFKRFHLVLFIIPITSLILLWTNDFHHLFYINYSINVSETVFGNYFYIHTIYTYGLYILGFFYLLKYSIKNSGIFSKQAILIVISALVPVVVNVLGYLQIISMSIYLTPICFSFTILLCAIAIFKFKLLSVAPIAMQKIVDRMSDSYIVLNEDGNITDFNKTFLTTFELKNDKSIRGQDFETFLTKNNLYVNLKKIKTILPKVKNTDKTFSFELYIDKIKRHFHIEINSILSNNESLGTLILFKDVTQHMQDMETIKDNQDKLMEKERLASLGQLIGGIAHNLKTPIMSIAGAAEGINDLIKEYDSSIGDPEVNEQDHHDIAKDMSVWVEKIRDYTEYMSDVITAVKGQAVTMSDNAQDGFTVEELVKRIDILMKHELKNALINLITTVKVDPNIKLTGNVNSLVQVINNMISNAIQAYNGKPNENIEFIVSEKNNNIIFTIKDYAGGLPKEVSDKLFKEMITTKGKNGTGLGLFMSYSNIRAHFNGNITFETKQGEGTQFNIILPK